MGKRSIPLDHVSVAAPCSVGWDNMIGNDQVRFCGQCNLNVYNLSGMTKRAAEHVVAQTEGRLCVRYYRRADGTILTKNCPVGLRALKRRLSRVATASLSAIVSFFAGMLAVTGIRELPLVPAATQGDVIKPGSFPAHVPGMIGEYFEPRAIAGQLMIEDPAEERWIEGRVALESPRKPTARRYR